MDKHQKHWLKPSKWQKKEYPNKKSKKPYYYTLSIALIGSLIMLYPSWTGIYFTESMRGLDHLFMLGFAIMFFGYGLYVGVGMVID